VVVADALDVLTIGRTGETRAPCAAVTPNLPRRRKHQRISSDAVCDPREFAGGDLRREFRRFLKRHGELCRVGDNLRYLFGARLGTNTGNAHAKRRNDCKACRCPKRCAAPDFL
jgi:hypothetical protein